MLGKDNIFSYKDLLAADKNFNKLSFVAFIILIPTLIGLVILSEMYLILLPVLIALPFVLMIIVKPKAWLYTMTASLMIFFHAGGEDVGVLDVVLGIFYVGSLAVYFVRKSLIVKEKIMLNIGDWAILTFFTLLLFNFVIAVANDVEPINWLREYLLIINLLMYFPVRDILKTENDVNKFLLFFAIIIILTGTYQIIEYYRKISTNIVYAYELKKSLTINQTLYTAASIIGFIFAFSQKNKWREFIIVGMTALYVVFLISTFSRTFWLVLGLAFLLMFFLLPAKKKVTFLTYLGVISSVVILGAFLLMKDKADIALSVAFERLESTSAGRKDVSLIARFKEWEKLTYHIKQNPLGGNGLTKVFTFHFPINSRARHTHIIHNGYIWLLYRTGIPMTLLFLFFLFYYTIKAINLIPKSQSLTQRALLIAALSVFLALYIVNLTSSQFFYRDGIFVTSMTIAFICIGEKLILSKNTRTE
ncbi:MAG: O-antigen ligase family protein [Candidatus Kapaibacterium sp.]